MNEDGKKIEAFELLDLIDITELERINKSFAEACGVASTLVDKTGTPIIPPVNHSRVCTIIRSTPLGRERCHRSAQILASKSIEQGRPYSRPCYGIGFVDASAPIVVKGKHLGNWLIGQGNLSDVTETRVMEYAMEIGADPKLMLEAFKSMTNMSRKEFDKKVEFLWVVTQQLCHHAHLNFKLSRSISLLKKTQYELQQHKLHLENTVKQRTAELEQSLAEVKQLNGLLPICSHCKKIRDDKGYWNQIEKYIHEHSDARFSHSICRECAKKHYPDLDLYDD